MKNKIMHLLCLGMLLLPVSFLSSKNAPVINPVIESIASAKSNYGGAYIIFAGKFGGEVTRKEIANNTEVKVDGCAKGSKIFQFTLYITKSGKTSTLKSQSNVLTGEMIAKLKTLTKGDSFEFRNTKANLPDNSGVVDVRGKKFIVV